MTPSKEVGEAIALAADLLKKIEAGPHYEKKLFELLMMISAMSYESGIINGQMQAIEILRKSFNESD